MTPLVDTAAFPVGDLDYTSEEEHFGLAELKQRALDHIGSRPWAPPVSEIVLAFGLAPIIGLFLIRFTEALTGELEGETEMWIVVGDLPTINFDTEMCPTPALALELYCCIAEHWAEMVLTGGDLLEAYPITAEPTVQHAEMLRDRTATLRKSFIPIAAGKRRLPTRMDDKRPPCG